MLRIFARRPAMYGLLEVDVTTPRRLIQDERTRTRTGLSFTAFLVGCLAQAVDENRQVQAFRKGRRHLIVFDEVDVATLIEVDAGHIRGLLWRALAMAPQTWKRHGGTVVLTSVGRLANGPGWGLSTPGGYPFGLTVGGIGEQTMPVAGSLELREYLSLTVSFDHAVLDGAPATRFASRLKQLIEDGMGLPGATPDGPAHRAARTTSTRE